MKLMVTILITSLAGQLLASETMFPSNAVDAQNLVITSNTDHSAITPLIRGFQLAFPYVDIVYQELNSNPLDDFARSGCDGKRFYTDIVISSSVAQQVKLVNDGCSQNIRNDSNATQIDSLPEWANWRNELVGLTYEAAAMVINKDAFSANWPQTHQDLISDLTANTSNTLKIGTYDISKSGVGYIFSFYDQIYSRNSQRLFDLIGASRAQLYCCSSQIIDAVADGNLDIGYNVLGSYAMYRAERDPRIHVQFPSDFTPVLTRAAFIPRTANNPDIARAFIGFALSKDGQDILNSDARLLSSVTGEDELQKLTGTEGGNFRPIALDPSLLISVDQATSQDFINNWKTQFNN